MEVIKKIVQWHCDRNLIDGATDEGQFKKLMSEFGEYSDNLAQGNCTKDDIGDMGVVLVNLAERNGCVESMINSGIRIGVSTYCDLLNSLNDIGYYMDIEKPEHYKSSIKENLTDSWEYLRSQAHVNGYDFADCLKHAYDDIKDRKGKMINGTFVKESDLV